MNASKNISYQEEGAPSPMTSMQKIKGFFISNDSQLAQAEFIRANALAQSIQTRMQEVQHYKNQCEELRKKFDKSETERFSLIKKNLSLRNENKFLKFAVIASTSVALFFAIQYLYSSSKN